MPKRKLVELVEGGGNTSSPPSRISASKYWCFTYNNYPEDAVVELCDCFTKHDVDYIFGKEVGKKGTPHLQGYVCTKGGPKENMIRPMETFKLPKDIHWEKRRKSHKHNVNYCSKDGDYYHSDGCKPSKRPLVKVTRELLRPNQVEIADMFKDYEDPLRGRKIYWFWEPKGNWGKSFLATHLIDFHDAIEVSGASKDIFCGIAATLADKDIKTVIFDVPRSSLEYISYQAIEKLKDGKFFSPKYESGMVRYNKPHIICFANEPPEEHKLSADRWIIRDLRCPFKSQG